MGILDRVKTTIQASVNDVVGKIEDPAKTLDLAYEQQSKSLMDIKEGLTTIATERMRLENLRVTYSGQVAVLDNQAGIALDNGNEELAKQLLQKKAVLKNQIDALNPQIKDIKVNEKSILETKAKVEQKLTQLGIEKETLKAQLQSSSAQARVNDAMVGISNSVDVSVAMEKAHQRIDKAKARTGAINELVQSGALNESGTDALTSQVNNITIDNSVNSDLERMKAQRKKKN